MAATLRLPPIEPSTVTRRLSANARRDERRSVDQGQKGPDPADIEVASSTETELRIEFRCGFASVAGDGKVERAAQSKSNANTASSLDVHTYGLGDRKRADRQRDVFLRASEAHGTSIKVRTDDRR